MTPSQIAALEELDDFGFAGLTPTEAIVRVGPHFRAILRSLVDRDLARYYPYGRNDGSWRITAKGRRALDEII